MIVRIYDFLSAEKPKFSENLVGIVSDVISFKYTRRAYDIGSFEMEIPTHADEAGYIQPDRMLIVGEKLSETYISGDPTRRIVNGTFLYVTEVDKNDQTITVTGYDLKYLFAMRVTLFPAEEQDKGTYGYYVVSGTTFSCISNLINYNIVNATDADRQMFGMSAITMPTTQVDAGLTGIQDDRYMTRLEPLSTAIFNLLKNCKTHFYDVRLLIDDNADDADNYNPHLESSEDKPTIIIDESRYNIKSYTRKGGTSAYKNAIYAVSGTGDDVIVKCVKRENDTASGINRKEVVLDVDTDSVSEIDRYAIKAAEDYTISDDFEIEPLFDDDDTEPALAQKVLIRIDGVDYETVITEITDEYSDGKHTQSYVCGDKKLKVLNVLNKATAGNTQKIINNKIDIGNKGGVGEFTNTDKTCEIFNDYENNTAQAYYSHAEGSETSATAPYSHAEGYKTTARDLASHSEGLNSIASGQAAHAEGEGCEAGGRGSHAGGYHTKAYATGMCSVGMVNKTTNALFVVGNGFMRGDEEYPSDALVVDNAGNLHIAGQVMADGGYDYNIPIATSTTIGGIKIGENLTISEDGTLSANPGGYTLPVATNDTLGGVMIGNNIVVADDGTISIDLSSYLKSADISAWAKQPTKPKYTASEVGAAKEYHTHSKADITDFPTLPVATSDTLGGVKVGDNLSVDDDGTLSAKPSASLFIGGATKMMLHQYSPIETKMPSYYYGSVGNDIICDGTLFSIEKPEGQHFYDYVFSKWQSASSGDILPNVDFKYVLVSEQSDGTISIKGTSTQLSYSTSLYTALNDINNGLFAKWSSIESPTSDYKYGRVKCSIYLHYMQTSGTYLDRLIKSGYVQFASLAEYNAAVCLTASEKPIYDMSTSDYTLIAPSTVKLLKTELPSVYEAEESVLYLVPNSDSTAFCQYMFDGSEWIYLGVTDHDMSEYLKTTDISDWAKADTKPTYTADEVGAAEAVHTHSDIAAVSLSGQTIDIDTLTASETANKGKMMRYYCPVASAQGITNRPTTANEPFALEVRNIRWASESSYISLQRYFSPSRRKEYTRWCTDGTWTAWQATDNRIIYGTIAASSPRTYAYTTYGEGYSKVKLTAMYGADEGSNMVNIKAATLVSTADFDRNMLTVGDATFSIHIAAGGDITLSVTDGTTTSFSFELVYFN